MEQKTAEQILKEAGWYDPNVSAGNYRIPVLYVLKFMEEYALQFKPPAVPSEGDRYEEEIVRYSTYYSKGSSERNMEERHDYQNGARMFRDTIHYPVLAKLQSEHEKVVSELRNQKCMNCTNTFDTELAGCICPKCLFDTKEQSAEIERLRKPLTHLYNLVIANGLTKKFPLSLLEEITSALSKDEGEKG